MNMDLLIVCFSLSYCAVILCEKKHSETLFSFWGKTPSGLL